MFDEYIKERENEPVETVTDFELKLGTVQVVADGTGIWNAENGLSREVELSVELTTMSDGYVFGEVNGKHAETEGVLFYSDRAVLKQIQDYLTGLGFTGSDVSWSEQGMQNYDNLHLDIGGTLKVEVLSDKDVKMSIREI